MDNNWRTNKSVERDYVKPAENPYEVAKRKESIAESVVGFDKCSYVWIRTQDTRIAHGHKT